MRTLLALAGLALALAPQDKSALKAALKDPAKGDWIYDDFPAAVAEAKKTGKPILAVLR
jgi:hypothetical protein